MSPAGTRVGAVLALCALVAWAGVQGACRESPASPPLVVFAAASLQTVLDELAGEAADAIGTPVTTVYAASSTLARQIESGAPADVFISADRAWMSYLSEHRAIDENGLIDLVGNDLVLVAPAGRALSLRIGPHMPMAEALGSGRLAVADPEAVPAGRYAREALTSLGVWSSVADRLAPADNVRAALVLVARGEVPLGIVYRTDALAEPRVQVIGVFPPDTHEPVRYPAAPTRHASAGARRLLEYLQSDEAAAVFRRHGFVSLRQQGEAAAAPR